MNLWEVSCYVEDANATSTSVNEFKFNDFVLLC